MGAFSYSQQMRSNAPENAENWYFNLFGRLLDWEVRNLTLL
jgi:hypothetical protein